MKSDFFRHSSRKKKSPIKENSGWPQASSKKKKRQNLPHSVGKMRLKDITPSQDMVPVSRHRQILLNVKNTSWKNSLTIKFSPLRDEQT